MEYTSTISGKVYFLHSMPGSGKSVLYYFAKVKNPDKACETVPNGYVIKESPNGFPILKKA